MATIQGELPALQGDIATLDQLTATISGTLDTLNGSIVAEVSPFGIIEGTVPALDGTVLAQTRLTATISGTLDTLNGSIVAEVSPFGIIEGTVPALDGIILGKEHLSATISGTLDSLDGYITDFLTNFSGALPTLDGSITTKSTFFVERKSPYENSAIIKTGKIIPYDNCVFVRKQINNSFRIFVEKGVLKRFGDTPPKRQLKQSYTDIIVAQLVIPYSLRKLLILSNKQLFSSITTVLSENKKTYDLVVKDTLYRTIKQAYSLQSFNTIFSSKDITSIYNPLGSVDIRISEGDTFWSGTAAILDVNTFLNIQINDIFTIELNGVLFSFVVDSKATERNGVSKIATSITFISKGVLESASRHEKLSYTNASPVLAHSVCEQILDQSVDWPLVNWQIPSGRLNFYETTPVDIVKNIVEAVGGVLESAPDGSFYARKKFPHSVPQWATQVADYVLTDNYILSIREEWTFKNTYNAVTLLGYQAQQGSIQLEVDNRANGYNKGKNNFYFGEDVYLLSYISPGVTGVTLETTSGKVKSQGVSSLIEVTQQIEFVNSFSVVLEKPATAIKSVKWYGNSLGTLTVQADKKTIIAQQSGNAIAEVVYYTNAQYWQVETTGYANAEPYTTVEFQEKITFTNTRSAMLSHKAQSIVSFVWERGGSPFPILLNDKKTIQVSTVTTGIANITYRKIISANNQNIQNTNYDSPYPVLSVAKGVYSAPEGEGAIKCIRGLGNRPTQDIVEPLLTSVESRLARGQAELDNGEKLQLVSITTILLPTLRLGMLLEVQDPFFGPSWKGKIVSISHNIQEFRATTALEVLRAT